VAEKKSNVCHHIPMVEHWQANVETITGQVVAGLSASRLSVITTLKLHQIHTQAAKAHLDKSLVLSALI
jgi:hypothetical protein